MEQRSLFTRSNAALPVVGWHLAAQLGSFTKPDGWRQTPQKRQTMVFVISFRSIPPLLAHPPPSFFTGSSHAYVDSRPVTTLWRKLAFSLAPPFFSPRPGHNVGLAMRESIDLGHAA